MTDDYYTCHTGTFCEYAMILINSLNEINFFCDIWWDNALSRFIATIILLDIG